MTETFRLLAEYNRDVNADMYDILGTLPHEDLVRDVGAHFGSALAVAHHVVLSDVHWMRRFAKGPEQWQFLAAEVADIRYASIFEPDATALSEIEPVRRKLDEAILRAMSLLREEDLETSIAYVSSQGSQQKTLWQAVLHFFNHQTHHRGQISLILDQLDVPNDYSNLIWRV